MAWSNSKVFTIAIENMLENTAAMDLDSDTFKAALFDNTITPSQTVTAANSAYGAGVWASGGVADAVSWPAAGIALSGVASSFTSTTYTFDASDTTSNDSTTDLASVYGCLVYDDTLAAPVADQGLVYIYFGGSNSVVNGVFTIVWNASGIISATA
jgi:hypothetical protein